MKLDEQIIADLAGIEMAVRSIAHRVAVLSEMGNADMKQMLDGAHAELARFSVEAPGLNGEAIRSRAEAVIDRVFATSSITMSGPS